MVTSTQALPCAHAIIVNLVMYGLAHEIKNCGLTPSAALTLFRELPYHRIYPCVRSMQHLKAKKADVWFWCSFMRKMRIFLPMCSGVGGSRLAKLRAFLTRL